MPAMRENSLLYNLLVFGGIAVLWTLLLCWGLKRDPSDACKGQCTINISCQERCLARGYCPKAIK